jgi:hypothetical protein
MLGLELEAEPTQSEVCADVMVAASIREHLASGADLRPGALLAAGFSRKLGNVQKLASDRKILLPLVASWRFPQRLGAPLRDADLVLAAARKGA